MLVSWWICHFGLFVFICKQLYDGPACLEMERNDSNRTDPNLSIIPTWLNMKRDTLKISKGQALMNGVMREALFLWDRSGHSFFEALHTTVAKLLQCITSVALLLSQHFCNARSGGGLLNSLIYKKEQCDIKDWHWWQRSLSEVWATMNVMPK